jgi:hypothetical protein
MGRLEIKFECATAGSANPAGPAEGGESGCSRNLPAALGLFGNLIVAWINDASSRYLEARRSLR